MPNCDVLLRTLSLFTLLFTVSFGLATPSYADDASATLYVHISDSSGALIVGATVVLRNTDTTQEQHSTSGRAGTTTFPFLKPGHYALVLTKGGFDSIAIDDITLNVGDEKYLHLVLKVGSSSQSITVNGSELTIDTTDASVSTVIDRTFVENTPLNGRSFQSLILLTPGTITNTPQQSSSIGNTGEFSVNGQRTESNYYTVDGVSANVGVSSNLAPNGGGPSGSLSASTALGTTQGLVSVDALQEFRVESSTYSAEYGRNPGGQFSMVTRSGTNDWHGSVFDYFRNDALDANNWFNDNTVPITPKQAERQNDFGGTLGGPIRLPHLYNGTNRSFFFFSYEGLRLVEPVATNVTYVPDTSLRQSASGPLQQALNAFPIPNSTDLGGGVSEYVGSWSNPSQLDATSLRLDHSIGARVHLFFRYSGTPSSAISRGSSETASTPSVLTSSTYSIHTYTFGATFQMSHNLNDDLRFNYSSNNVQNQQYEDSFGGAVPVNLNQLQGVSANGEVLLLLEFGAYNPLLEQSQSSTAQKQWNLVNTVNVEHGRHSTKIGVDWRRLTPDLVQATPDAEYVYLSPTTVSTNSVDIGVGVSDAPAYPVYTNFSAFIQDAWKINSRLSLSTGIRWDVNPAPGVAKGIMPYTVIGLNDPSTMSLAPEGTPLWRTSWYNFAPRLGFAYLLDSSADRETVLRGGGGVFFDTGQQTGSAALQGPGLQATNYFGNIFGVSASFPVPVAMVAPPVSESLIPPYGPLYANPANLQLPFTFQWNASLEQALGRTQSFTLSYVGSNGRKLLQEQDTTVQNNPDFGSLYVFKNGLTSSYNALQVKYQKQVSRSLQAIASYTWSHNLDYSSFDLALPYQRASSDNDVRHNANAAISYNLPSAGRAQFLRTLSSDWGLDGRVTVRTGFPVGLQGNTITDPVTGQQYVGGLNLIPNTPLYLYGSRSVYPGGRSINPAAFAPPAAGEFGNAPRNFIRGFGASQLDIAIRRSFPIHERLQGQFRAESFNIFNHPNFGYIDPTYGDVQFGQATATLSQSLGTLSPLYQMGGPRSLQLTLKLTF